MQLITPKKYIKKYNLFTYVGNILISGIIFVFFVGCSEPCDGQSWYDTLSIIMYQQCVDFFSFLHVQIQHGRENHVYLRYSSSVLPWSIQIDYDNALQYLEEVKLK